MLEAGESPPCLHHAVALAAVLQVDVVALVADGVIGSLPPHAEQTLTVAEADRRLRSRVKSLRLARHWGTPRLATAAGVCRSWLCDVENGGSPRIRLDHALSVAAALDAPLSVLIGDAEPAAPRGPRKCRWPGCLTPHPTRLWGGCCMKHAKRVILMVRKKPTTATHADVARAAKLWKEWHP